jgi:hypothetical protein
MKNKEKGKNGFRIAKGRELVHVHMKDPDEKATVYDENVIDAVTDLLHYAAAAGFAPERITRCAMMHYEAEAGK